VTTIRNVLKAKKTTRNLSKAESFVLNGTCGIANGSKNELNPFLLRSFAIVGGVDGDDGIAGCLRWCRWFTGVDDGSVELPDRCDVRFAVEAEFDAHEMLDDAGVTRLVEAGLENDVWKSTRDEQI
jgi:hypothetical protein